MFDVSPLATSLPLPRPEPGWYPCSSSILIDGTLALLQSRDAPGTLWKRAGQDNGLNLAAAQDELRIVIVSEDGAEVVAEMSGPPWSSVQRLANGRWLLLAGLMKSGEPNAFVHDVDGREVARFDLGDGIEDIACTPDGSIWTSYFDEGVYGSSTLSHNGLVRFSSDGEVLWSALNDPAFQAAGMVIDDCYSMATAGDDVWVCYYSDFPIMRWHKGEVTFWMNEYPGAKAMVASGNSVLMVGGYRAKTRSRLTLLRTEHGVAPIHPMRFEFPVMDVRRDMVRGRDGVLHVLTQDRWWRLDMAAVVAVADEQG